MTAAVALAGRVGVRAACTALAVARPTYYRHRQPAGAARVRPRPPLALSAPEEQAVLDVLHSERFVDQSPTEVYATLLDDKVYHCSARTMYRVLARHDELHERRRQLVRPAAVKPELLATAPTQVWSWDIPTLLGPVKWTYFYLYVLLAIFSRYGVGWLIAEHESAALARRLIAQSCAPHGIERGPLTVHSDRGPSMTSQLVAQLLADRGLTQTHSRPYTSNDNPFSEALFKTTTYRPEFPERFGALNDALTFGRVFFPWYNTEHHHSGIGFLTPEMVHYGQSTAVLQARSATLARAFELHPARFKGRQPQPPRLLPAVWINPPSDAAQRLAGKPDLIASSQSDDGEAVQGTGIPENGSASAEALASSRSALQ
jgi:putative transposase